MSTKSFTSLKHIALTSSGDFRCFCELHKINFFPDTLRVYVAPSNDARLSPHPELLVVPRCAKRLRKCPNHQYRTSGAYIHRFEYVDNKHAPTELLKNVGVYGRPCNIQQTYALA